MIAARTSPGTSVAAVAVALGVALVFAAACTFGVPIDLKHGADGTDDGSPDGGPAHGTPPPPGPCVDSGLPAARIWTLSRSEYDNAVSALLGDNAREAERNFPGENRVNGFSENARAQVVTSSSITLLMTAAETIATRAVDGELAFVATSLQCTLSDTPTADAPDPCATSYITSRGSAFFRRPLTANEVADLYATYLVGVANPYDNTGATASGVELVVATMLQMPQFLYRTELGADGDASSPVDLTQYEIASAISFIATGFPPDASLVAAADAGALDSADAVTAQLDRLVATDAGHAQMEKLVLEWLREDGIENLGNAGGPLPPEIASGMLNESQSFIEEALFHGSGTLDELLTGPYTFADQNLADYYGLAGGSSSIGADFAKVSLDATSGRAGLLSQGAFLASSATSGVPLLHRGRVIRERLLCETLPSVASLGLPGFTPPPFSSPPAGTTTRHALENTIVSGTACFACHQYFQPLGYGLEGFDATGKHQSAQNGGAIDPSGAIVESTSVDPASGLILLPTDFTTTAYADYRSLTSTLASDPRVSTCFALQAVSYASGSGGVGLNDCMVESVQKPGDDGKKPTVQEQLRRYVRSPSFVKRAR